MARYAWSNIKLAHRKVIRAGSEVTKDDVGDDWKEFNANGVIRKEPLPKNMKAGESPKTAMLRAAREQFESAQEPYQAEGGNSGNEPQTTEEPQNTQTNQTNQQ